MHLDSVSLKLFDLARIVGHYLDLGDPEHPKDRRRIRIVAIVDRQSEVQIRIDGVRAEILFHVCPQLVDETDPAALVTRGIDQDTPPGGRDGLQRGPQLNAAVASQGAQHVTRKALGVNAGKDRLTVRDISFDQSEVDVAAFALESARFEWPEGGGKRDADLLNDRHFGVVPAPVDSQTVLPKGAAGSPISCEQPRW